MYVHRFSNKDFKLVLRMVDYNGVIFERSTLQSDRSATGDGFDPPKVETHFLPGSIKVASRT